MAELTKAQMDQMLEECAGYEVTLEEDPTQPHLGLRYLQKALATCRNYTNRTVFYLQKVLRYEKDLKRAVKTSELDLEFKIKEKLADDQLVRKQPSIEDRKAAATVMYKEEYDLLSEMKALVVDVEESARLLRMKYNDLQRTSNEIKLQRQMVKDDQDSQLRGEAGYSSPVINQDRSVPNGMAAPVTERIDPKDLLDPNRKPDEIPEPKDAAHAQLIADFLSRNPEKGPISDPGSQPEAPAATPAPHARKAEEDGTVATIDYDNLLD